MADEVKTEDEAVVTVKPATKDVTVWSTIVGFVALALSTLGIDHGIVDDGSTAEFMAQLTAAGAFVVTGIQRLWGQTIARIGGKA